MALWIDAAVSRVTESHHALASLWTLAVEAGLRVGDLLVDRGLRLRLLGLRLAADAECERRCCDAADDGD